MSGYPNLISPLMDEQGLILTEALNQDAQTALALSATNEADIIVLQETALQLAGTPAEYTGLPSTAMTIDGIITGDTISSTGDMYASGTVNTLGLNIIKNDETGYYNTFANATGITINAPLTTPSITCTGNTTIGGNCSITGNCNVVGVVNSNSVNDCPIVADYSISHLDFANTTTTPTIQIGTQPALPTSTNAISSSGQFILIASANAIYSSSNYGQTFGIEPTLPTTPNTAGWGHVAMSLDGKTRWVATYNAGTTGSPNVYVSTNYGQSYTAVLNTVLSRLLQYFQITLSETGKYVAVGTIEGAIYYSSNFGASFILSKAVNVTNGRIMMSPSGRYCTFAGFHNGFKEGTYYNDQYGAPSAWVRIPQNPIQINNLAISSSGQFQALCGINIWLSQDFGKTFVVSSAPTQIFNDYYDVCMSSTGQYMAAVLYSSTNSSFLYSDDYGKSWITFALTASTFLRTINMSSTGQYIVITNTSGGNNFVRTVFVNQRMSAVSTTGAITGSSLNVGSGAITSGLINSVNITTLNSQTVTNTSDIASLTTNKLSLSGTTSDLNMNNNQILNCNRVNTLNFAASSINGTLGDSGNNNAIFNNIYCQSPGIGNPIIMNVPSGNITNIGTTQSNIVNALTDIRLNGTSIISKDPLYDVWVSANGNASFSGSFGRPFQTIQQAVNYCETFTDGKNRTINLYSGDYTENITLSKSRISIKGSNTASQRANLICRITGNITIAITSGNSDLNNNNISLSDLFITGAVYDTTTFNSPHRVNIKNCFIYPTDNALTMDVINTTDYRLYIDSCTIQNSDSNSNQPLVRCNGSGMVSITNSQFTQSGIENVLQLNGTVRTDTMALTSYINSSTSASVKAIVAINTGGANVCIFGQNSFVYSSATVKSNATTASAIFLNPVIASGNSITLIILNNFISLIGLPGGGAVNAIHTTAPTGYYYVLYGGNYSSSSGLGASAHHIAGAKNTNKFEMTVVE
jgi:hypothetical protein